MDVSTVKQTLINTSQQISQAAVQPETYSQLALVLVIFAFAFFISNRVKRYIPLLAQASNEVGFSPLRRVAVKFGNLLFPLLTILILSLATEASRQLLGQAWLVQSA